MFGTHYKLERKSVGLALAIIGVASIGGLIEIAPLFTIDETVEHDPDMRVYTPLELAGRNIYMREGCYGCHSQMIRTLKDEVDRYGPYSLAVESQYDHPMLWGSKRTGPDLARSAASIRTSGRSRTCSTRATWCRARSCRAIAGSPRPSSRSTTSAIISPRSARSACRTTRSRSERHRRRAGAGLAREGHGRADRALRRGHPRRRVRRRPRTVTEMDALVAYLQVLGKLTDKAYEQQQLAGR
jgi:cytochrome c oxidase cbb3-type subunit 2